MKTILPDPCIFQPKPIVHCVNKAIGKFSYFPKTAQSYLLAMCCMGFHPHSLAINTSQLNGDNGFNIDKINIDDRLYLREQSIGDVNGDGINDFLIDNSIFFEKQDAKTHIIFGAVGNTIPANVKLEELNGSNGFTIDAQFSGIVDITGDGISDIIVADFSSVKPQYFVIFGQDVSLKGNFPANISLLDINGANGFRVVDSVNDGNLYIVTQGDLSGDGIDDIVVSENHSYVVEEDHFYGGTYFTFKHKTSLYLVFGRKNQNFPANLSLSQLDGTDGFRINDAFMNVSDYDGSTKSYLDSDTRIDFDGDGINELMYTEEYYLGRGYNIYTRDLSFANISELESNGEFPAVVDGLSEIPIFSTSISSLGEPGSNGNIGDINGDGIDDIAQVSWNDRYYTDSTNRAVITFGAADNSFNQSGVKQLIFNNESIQFSSESNDGLITALGDINGDGLDDVHLMTVNNYSNKTKDSFILFGRNTTDDGEFPEKITPEFFNGSNGFILRGSTEDETFTRRGKLQSGGDFNNDDINDIVYLVNDYDYPRVREGRANIIYGQAEPFPELVLVSELSDSIEVMADEIISDTGLFDATLFADINNDGADDLIIQSDSISVIYGTSGISGSPKLACLGDVDNNGEQDLVVLFKNRSTNLVNAVVKDINGNLVSTVKFNPGFNPSAIKVIDDINNNLSPELVAIDKRSAKAEVRDALTGELLNTIGFHTNGDSVDIEPLIDQNGNNAVELVSLNSQGKVNIKDALNSQTISRLNFQSSNFKAKDISIINTLPPQIAVLAENKNKFKLDKVTVKDLSTGRTLKNIWYGKQWDAQQLELISDQNGNGSLEVAVLRHQKNKVNVLIRDSKTGSLINSQGYNPQYRPLKMESSEDLNNNASDEIVLLSHKVEGGLIAATVKDSSTNETINTLFFNKKLKPLDMAVCDDMNGNNKPEIAVLGEVKRNGELQLVVKDAKTGKLVGRVEF